MAAVEEIAIKLGIKVGDFKAALASANASIKEFKNSGEAGAGGLTSAFGKLAEKIGGFKALTQTLATALGLNLQSIAESFARAVAGLSKEQEDLLTKSDALREQNTTKSIEQIRARGTAEQQYQTALKERASLQKKIEEFNVREPDILVGIYDGYKDVLNVVEQGAVSEKKVLELEELRARQLDANALIVQHENKLRDERLKVVEETNKLELDGIEKEFQARVALLTPTQQIKVLEEDRLNLINQLEEGNLHANEISTVTQRITERTNQILTEQVARHREIIEVTDKNQKAEQDAADRRIERATEDLNLQTQREQTLQHIKTLEELIKVENEFFLDTTEDINDLDKERAKLKEVEKKQAEQNLELAKLLLIPADKLTKSEQLRIDLLTNQTTQLKINAEIAQILSKGAANLTTEDKSRLAVLTGQSTELQNQINKLQAIAELTVTIKRTGQDYANQTTAALEGVLSRVKKQLDEIRLSNAQAPASQRNPFEVTLNDELRRISDELTARANIRSFINSNTENAARAKYGDTLVDQALRETMDATQQTAVAVTKLQLQFQDFLKLPPVQVPVP